jgi:hypothetical protein
MLRCLLVLFFALIMGVPLAHADRESTMIEKLTSAKTEEALNAAADEAKKEGLPRQMVVEAKLVFGMQTQNTPLLVALLPELEAVALDFKPSNSISGLSTVEQFRGLIAYARAMNALDKKNADDFQEFITEGFWNFPQQAALFGDAVAKFQLEEKMARWSVDFGTQVLVSGGKVTTLGSVLGVQKALLVVFWAGTSAASDKVLPTLQGLANHLKPFNITVAGLNVDYLDAESTAEKKRAEHQITIPWLVEGKDRTLSRQLEVTSLPRALLITQQGRVIFHGPPQGVSLWKALKRVAPILQPMK